MQWLRSWGKIRWPKRKRLNRMAKIAVTYSAFYMDDSHDIIYYGKPDDGTLDQFPFDAKPVPGRGNTYLRTDGGDRFENAVFQRTDGRRFLVIRI